MPANYCMLLKVVTVITLAILFVINSKIIFEYYIQGKMVSSSSIQVNKKGKQMLPTIAICREKAYDSYMDMSSRQGFLDNTLALRYYAMDDNWKIIDLESSKMDRSWVYSYTRGTCNVLKYKEEVR